MTASIRKDADRTAVILPFPGPLAEPLALLNELGDLMPGGVAILGRDASLVFANGAFRAAMKTAARAMDDRLRLTDPAADLRLQEALKRAAAGEDMDLPLGGLSLRLTPGGLPGFIRVVAETQDNSGGEACKTRLQQAFGLTVKEADTALSLSEGMTAGAIAEDRGVSITTVRTQLQMIREKLGVTSSLAAAAEIRALAATH